MESDFRQILIDDASLTALVPPDRISYRDNDEGKPNPRITYQIVSEIPDEELDEEGGYIKSRVQVDVWADTDASALAVKRAVNDRLKSFEGIVGSTEFLGIFRSNRRDQVVRAANGKQRGQRRITLEFEVHYKE